jgi:hypothetical protein
MVAGHIDYVVVGELRIERLAKGGAQLGRRQLKRPAPQRVAVMIDRGLARPRFQQLACQYL